MDPAPEKPEHFPFREKMGRTLNRTGTGRMGHHGDSWISKIRAGIWAAGYHGCDHSLFSLNDCENARVKAAVWFVGQKSLLLVFIGNLPKTRARTWEIAGQA